MVDKKKFYIFIELNTILFLILSENNKILFEKKTELKDFTLEENFFSLENFLEKNLFFIEKKFKNFIKDITLIINFNNFLNIELSSTLNLNYLRKQELFFSSDLLNLKNYMTKQMNDYYLINIIMNKLIIDGKEYFLIPENIKSKKVNLELKFSFIKKAIMNKYKKIFFNFGIKIKKIIDLKLLDSINKTTTENLVNTILKLESNQNNLEINFSSLKTNKTGFFIKFFDLFR